MKRRILSIITALALCLSLCPTWALAAEADPALCPHHREHTEDCGYTAPAEGQPCGHEHTAECYALEVLPDTESGDDYEIGADTENLLDCQHTHDSECGYAQADPGQPCGYECRICPIEDLIAALPDKVTEDNADEVRAQLDEILALFSVLTEDEQEQIDLSRCYALQGVLDGANAPMLAADGAATVEINGVTTTYATFKEAWDAANSGGQAVLTLHKDVDVYSAMGYNALTVNAGSDIELRGGSYTITSNAGTASGLTTIGVKGKFTLTDGTITNTSSDAGTCTLHVRPGTTAVISGGAVIGRAGIKVDGGSLTVTGGTVNGSAEGIGITNGVSANISGGNVSASAGNGIYVYGNSKLTMTGGTVYGSEYGVGVWCMGESGLSSVALSGGNISGGEYAIKVLDPSYNRINVSSLLGAGCAYYNESGSLIDYPETSTLTDSVTIGVCDHSSARWEQNDTEHQSICRGCNKQRSSAAPHSFTEFKDLGNGKHQFSCECGWVQEPVAHTYGDWSDENGSHVRSCTVCGAEERGAHSFHWQDNGDETHTGTCEVCGQTETKAHSFKWTHNNDTHTKTCTDCGKAETAPHNWKWTPMANIHTGQCPDCGATTMGNHKISGYQQCDEDDHYINCSICGEKAMRVLHRYGSEWVDAGDVHTKSCRDNCGYAKSESHTYGPYQPGDTNSHIHSCTACGHKEVGTHSPESSWRQDDNGHYHLCWLCKWEMDRTAHTYGAWKADGAENHSHTCSVCRYKQSEAHTWDENQRCTVCGFSAGEVAIVSIEGAEDKAFTELTDAWAYAATNSSADKPATVRLMLSANISKNLEVRTGKNIILEMADGVVLTSSDRGISVAGGAFTLNSGTVQADGENGIAVYDSGTAQINGGTVTASLTSVSVTGTGSQIYINGGSFSGERAAVELTWATSQIEISGGTFSNTNSGDTVFRGYSSANASVYVNTMIAEGYFVYGPDGNRLSDSDLAVRLLKGGPFTVRECEHSYKYAHEEGTTAHSQVCTFCGHEKDSENCTFTNGACSCGAKLAVTLNGAEDLTYTGTAQEPGITVTVDGQTLAAGNYTVIYADNINAGTATVTISSDNFTGEVKKIFSIGKAALTITAKDQTITYNESITQGTDQVTHTTLCTGDTLQSVTLAASGTDITPSGAQIQNASGKNVTDNYKINYQTGTLTIQKSKPTIAFVSGYNPSKVYDGQTVAKPTAEQLTITGASYDDVTFTWSATPKDAGTYTLTASIKETDSMEAASATLNVTISKATLTATGADITPKTYDKTDSATVETVTFTGLVNGETLALGTDYTATGTFGSADAGENKSVTVTVALKESATVKNYQLSNGTVNATGTITRVSSTITHAPAASGITYGQALSDSKLTGGTGNTEGRFTWTAPDTKPNAGTAEYSVTFTPDDANYDTATVNVSVIVAKATPSLTAPAASAIEYGQKLFDSALTGGEAKNPHGNAATAGTWSWANGDTRPTATGTFPVAFAPSDIANYNTPANVDTSVTVNPTAPKITLTVPAYQVAGEDVIVTCTVENPHDATFKEGIPENITLTYQIGSGTPQTITNGKFSIPAGTKKDTVITVTASTDAVNGKYTAATKTATVTVTDKIPVEISGISVTGRVYNGQPFNYTGTPVVKKLDGTVVTDALVSYTWSSVTAPVNAGDYSLVVAVGGGKYIGSTTIPVVIEQAEIRVTAPSKTIYVGETAPVFSAADCNITGLVQGENLKTPPTVAYAEAPDTSKTGSVTVTASGAEVPEGGNYKDRIVYENGTLTITSKPLPPAKYTVTVQAGKGGTASASPTSAEKGTKITLNATPDGGYHFKEWQVISGGVTISNNSFTMPAANVTVKAMFEKVKKPSVPEVRSFRAKPGKKKLVFSWKKVPGAAGFQIQISTKKGFKGAKTISVSKSNKTYTKKGLKTKKKYYIRIRAYKTYLDKNKKTKRVYGKWIRISKKTR